LGVKAFFFAHRQWLWHSSTIQLCSTSLYASLRLCVLVAKNLFVISLLNFALCVLVAKNLFVISLLNFAPLRLSGKNNKNFGK
jgi:hypothetical protein